MQEHIFFCHTVTLPLSSSSSTLTLFHAHHSCLSVTLLTPFSFPTLCHHNFSTLSPFSPFTFSLTLFLCNSRALSLSFIIFHILYFSLPLSVTLVLTLLFFPSVTLSTSSSFPLSYHSSYHCLTQSFFFTLSLFSPTLVFLFLLSHWLTHSGLWLGFHHPVVMHAPEYSIRKGCDGLTTI